MAQGNWSVALYLDERADEQQNQALQAIFTGAAGGPVAALALIAYGVLVIVVPGALPTTQSPM